MRRLLPRRLWRFSVKLRHFLRFRQWPHNVHTAELNLRFGYPIFLTKGSVIVPAAEPEPPGGRPIGVITRVNEDGTYTMRLGGKDGAT